MRKMPIFSVLLLILLISCAPSQIIRSPNFINDPNNTTLFIIVPFKNDFCNAATILVNKYRSLGYDVIEGELEDVYNNSFDYMIYGEIYEETIQCQPYIYNGPGKAANFISGFSKGMAQTLNGSTYNYISIDWIKPPYTTFVFHQDISINRLRQEASQCVK